MTLVRAGGLAALLICGATVVAGCSTPAPASTEIAAGRSSEAEMSGWKGTPGEDAAADIIAAGGAIAHRECASCHAVERTGRSPLKAAPPLRDVLAMYEDSDQLAYRFIDGMRVGHDQMPLFDFDVRSADALIAYIQTLETPKRR